MRNLESRLQRIEAAMDARTAREILVVCWKGEDQPSDALRNRKGESDADFIERAARQHTSSSRKMSPLRSSALSRADAIKRTCAMLWFNAPLLALYFWNA